MLPAKHCSYIISNPPFVGKQYQKQQQKDDLAHVAGDVKGYGVLDFVTAWYFKAAEYINHTSICVALVSTNSITQGEQVSVLWRGLAKYNLTINFAHRTFKWMNEGKGVAGVHCVIVGFSQIDNGKRRLFDYSNGIDKEPIELAAKQINAYLVDAGWVLLEKRRTAVVNCSSIDFGSMPNDGGNLLLNKVDKDELVALCPSASKWIRRLYGSEEYINNIERYCLWLYGITPNELRSMPEVIARVDAVKKVRTESTRKATQKLAAYPTLFGEIRHPKSGKYLLLPSVSSENRNYIPIGFLDAEDICSNLALLIPNATLYDFAVVTSSLHMAWTRAVCGRLESRYRYSAGIVYNNFVWPKDVTDAQRKAVEETAQAILDARAKFPSSSLADLYDPLAMPPELVKAHEANNKAVDKAYGYKGAGDDASRVAFLFKLYEELTSLLPVQTKRKTSKVVVK